MTLVKFVQSHTFCARVWDAVRGLDLVAVHLFALPCCVQSKGHEGVVPSCAELRLALECETFCFSCLPWLSTSSRVMCSASCCGLCGLTPWRMRSVPFCFVSSPLASSRSRRLTGKGAPPPHEDSGRVYEGSAALANFAWTTRTLCKRKLRPGSTPTTCCLGVAKWSLWTWKPSNRDDVRSMFKGAPTTKASIATFWHPFLSELLRRQLEELDGRMDEVRQQSWNTAMNAAVSGLTEAVRSMGQSVSKPRPEDMRVGKPEPYAPGKDFDD